MGRGVGIQYTESGHADGAVTFWETIGRPIIGLAPMDGITDHPFRFIQKRYGQPALLYTEFASVEGICAGDLRLLKDFLYDGSQRPIVGQIFGRTPECFRQAAIMLCQLGFNGIDINMGCPTKSVAQRGAGAALIKTPALAQEIVQATKLGVRQWQNGATVRDCADLSKAIVACVEVRYAQLPPPFQQRRPIPVSVKTRIGYDMPQVDEWVAQLLESEPAAIAMHGRTLTAGYSGQADWDQIGQAAALMHGSGVPLLGNGDVTSLEDAHRRVADYSVDGVLIGRASYGNPFVFRPADESPLRSDPHRLLHVALAHARLYEASFGHHQRYHFPPMRKHLGWYARNLPGAKHLRRELTQSSSLHEAETIIERYFAYRQRWHD